MFLSIIKKLLQTKEVNTIIIATAWESHVEIAHWQPMYAGKAVAMEVGGAYSLEDCYKLVDAYEKTKTPFMFLEKLLLRPQRTDGVETW